MKHILLVIALLTLLTVPLMAQQDPSGAAGDVNFTWDLSLDDAFLHESEGYWLYAAQTSGGYNYANPVAKFAKGVSSGGIARPGLGTWYFTMRAVAPDYTQSENSNEVSATFAPRPPHITGIIHTAINAIQNWLNQWAQNPSTNRAFGNLRIIGNR